VTQISLSKVYAVIDAHRGRWLDIRKNYDKYHPIRLSCNSHLRLLNKLKKEFALVSDAEQLPLGL
jgi:hypothetical protein